MCRECRTFRRFRGARVLKSLHRVCCCCSGGFVWAIFMDTTNMTWWPANCTGNRGPFYFLFFPKSYFSRFVVCLHVFFASLPLFYPSFLSVSAGLHCCRYLSLPFGCLFILLLVCLSVGLSFLLVCLSVGVPTFPSSSVFTCPGIKQPFFPLPCHLSVCLLVFPSFRISVGRPTFSSSFLFVCVGAGSRPLCTHLETLLPRTEIGIRVCIQLRCNP